MRTRRGFILVTVLCVSFYGAASADDAVQPAAVAPPAQPAAAPKDAVVPAAKPETKPAAAASDPVVCKKVKETGSRTSGKEVCMTASQWQQQKKNSRDVMNSIPSHNVGANAGN
jgi:hypothetical protein